jgi:hypothetical protein
VALAQDYLTTHGPERAAFVVRHALEAAKAVDLPIQTFGGTKNVLPQVLALWEGRAEAEEARREADARTMECPRIGSTDVDVSWCKISGEPSQTWPRLP